MKFSLSLILVLVIAMIPLSAFAADDTVEKTDCKLAIGYDSMDELKADLLLSAKRLAVNELFGELITAATAVEDFVVTSDQIRASSLGLVRENAIRYYNGDNLGEICITIAVYTTEEDRKQFVPVKLNKRNCVSEPDLTARELRKFAEEEAVVKALTEYNRKLEKQERGSLLKLMQRVTYLESGMLPDTDTYCVRAQGFVTPIEVTAIFQNASSDEQTTPFIFLEEFDGIDESLWEADGPSATINNGVIQFESNISAFPFIYNKQEIFPPHENFVVESVFRYPTVSPWGDGIVIDRNVPVYGSQTISGPYVMLQIWQGQGYPLEISFMGQQIFKSLEVDTKWHTIKVRYDGQYQISLDEELIHTSPPTPERPTNVWLGNFYNTGQNGKWTSLEVDYISIQSIQ